jgi:hypothetical protein
VEGIFQKPASQQSTYIPKGDEPWDKTFLTPDAGHQLSKMLLTDCPWTPILKIGKCDL